MGDAGELSELLEHVYDTVYGSECWTRVLEHLRGRWGLRSATLIITDIGSENGNVAAFAGFDDAAMRLYQEYYHACNPWFRDRPERLVPGWIGQTHIDSLPTSELVKTEFYADFMRPQDFLYSTVGVLFRDDSRAGTLTVETSERAGPLSEGALREMRRLLPHLQRAAQLRRLAAHLQAERDSLAEALHRLGHAILLLDRRGRVIFANPSARSVLARGDGLGVDARGHLRTVRKRDQDNLLRCISAAIPGPRAVLRGAGGVVPVSRPSGLRPFAVFVAPLPAASAPLGPSRPSVALLVADPEASLPSDEDALRALFGLTPAEARLAARVAEGWTLFEVGDRLGLTRHTVRSCLKVVFEKTGTRRQAELVALLGRLRSPRSRG